MKTLKWGGGLGVAIFAAGNMYAQDPVPLPRPQDLVGARGSSGEQASQDGDYTSVRTSKSGSDSYGSARARRVPNGRAR
jgi:hypothetical protein